MSEQSAAPTTAIRVSTLELFFDLVFVFTVTQLTAILAEHLDVKHLVDVLLLLGVIWWMYSGYAWLTNAVAPNSTMRRSLLLTGMAGFLVMALAIPDAFGRYGWLFGVSYLVVNLVHTALFLRAGALAAVALRRLGPLNITSALLVLVGGVVPEPFRHLCWAAAVALQILTPYLHRIEMHVLHAGHFVERHGLVVIVAIGESIIAIGVGAEGLELDAALAAVAVGGLALSACMWWTYFGGDDELAEARMAAAPTPQRSRMAL